MLSRQSREIKKAEQERVAQQVLGTKLTFGNYNRECRTILSDARRIIADRRASDELAREEKKNEDLLQQIFEEQKNLKQLVLKPSLNTPSNRSLLDPSLEFPRCTASG